MNEKRPQLRRRALSVLAAAMGMLFDQRGKLRSFLKNDPTIYPLRIRGFKSSRYRRPGEPGSPGTKARHLQGRCACEKDRAAFGGHARSAFLEARRFGHSHKMRDWKRMADAWRRGGKVIA